MMENFCKYWRDYCIILSIAMVGSWPTDETSSTSILLFKAWSYYLWRKSWCCKKQDVQAFWWVCESKFHFIEYINKFSTCSFSWTKFQFRGNPRDGRIRSIGCKLIDLLISYILCLLIIWYLVFINVFCLSYNVMGIYQSCEWKC